MLKVNDMNPGGSWEQGDMVWLNGDILDELGGSFLVPFERERGWELSPAMAPYRARIAALIEELFDGRQRWGFKSPLAIATLPIWQSVIGELDFVICVRNPIEFVQSARTWVPDVRELDPIALWRHHNCEALRLTAGHRRTFVFYEDWFGDPIPAARDLAVFLHGSADAVPPGAWGEIAAVVDSSLRRQRASELDLAESDEVAVEARALYFLLRSLAEAERNGDERAAALHAVAAALDGDVVVRSRSSG